MYCPFPESAIASAVGVGTQLTQNSSCQAFLLEASNALNYRAWGIPAVLSRGIPGNALRAFPGSSGISPEFFREVPAVLGVWPIIAQHQVLSRMTGS